MPIPTPLIGMKLTRTIRMPKILWAVVLPLSIALLPYWHDIITERGTGLRAWVPVFGIESFFTRLDGSVMAFSTYRKFLYFSLLAIFLLIGSLAWFWVAKGKRYRYALLCPIASNLVYLIIILFGVRGHWINSWEFKCLLVLCVSIGAYWFTLQNGLLGRRVKWRWMAITILGLMPFAHNILTSPSGIRAFVPILGVEDFIFNGSDYWGFRSYRALLLFFFIHLYGHLLWLGAFMFYGLQERKKRMLLLLPMITSIYPMVIFFFGLEDTGFNEPDIKLIVTICVAALLFINFFFNDRETTMK